MPDSVFNLLRQDFSGLRVHDSRILGSLPGETDQIIENWCGHAMSCREEGFGLLGSCAEARGHSAEHLR